MRQSALALRTKAARRTGRTPDATAGGPSSTRLRPSRTRIEASVVDGQSVIVNVPMTEAAPIDYSRANLLRTARMHEIVNACLRVRADSLVAPVLQVERRQEDGSYAPEMEHPLIALFRAPGPNLDAATLWRCLSVSWDAVGICYLEPLTTTDGMLAGLNPLDPSLVTERYDSTGNLEYYEWWPGYGDRVRFLPDELIVRRTVPWADPAPLVSAMAAVDSDWSQTDYVRSFFSNAGVPSGILKVKGTWSKDRAGELQERWTQKYGRHGLNAGGPAVLDENAEYQRVGAQMNELESESLRAIAESRITMVFGVPPLIIYAFVGLLRSTYSNLKEAWASFWDSTATPLLVEWSAWLTRSLLAAYEDPADILLGNVRVTFNKTGVGPYVEDATAKIAQLKDGLTRGAVTVNEYRAALGLDARPDGDVYLRNPTSQVPDEASKATHANSRQKSGANGAIATMPRLVPPPGREVKAGPVPPRRLDRDVEAYLRDEYARARRIALAGGNPDTVTAQIDRELDDGTALFGILAPHERKAYSDAWKKAAQDINAQLVLDTGDVTSAVDVLARRCTGITDTTRQEIAAIITDGAINQTSDAEIAAQIAALGLARSKERAPIITRTELATASVKAATDAYRTSGVVESVTWLTGPDSCDDCQARDGKSFVLDDSLPEIPAHPSCVCDWAPNVTSEVAA